MAPGQAGYLFELDRTQDTSCTHMGNDYPHEVSVGLTLYQVVLTDPNQLALSHKPLQCIRRQSESLAGFTQRRGMNTTSTQTPDQFIEDATNVVIWHGLVPWKSQTVAALIEASLDAQGGDERLNDALRRPRFEHGPKFGQGRTIEQWMGGVVLSEKGT